MPTCLAYVMLEKCVSLRRDAKCQQLCCFIVGETPLLKTSVSLWPYACFFKFMRCFAMAKQHFQHAHVNQKGSMGNQTQSRKQQNNKKTKIPGSKGSQNHRENQQTQENQDFRTNG